MLSFFVIVGLILAILTPVVLAVIGVQRGLEGRMTIFSGWGDFAFTCAMLLLGLLSLPIVLNDRANAHIVLTINGLIEVIWLLGSCRKCHHFSELWFSIPARLALVAATVLGTLFAIGYIEKALKTKTAPRERMINGALAAGVGTALAKVLDIARKLIRQAELKDGWQQ